MALWLCGRAGLSSTGAYATNCDWMTRPLARTCPVHARQRLQLVHYSRKYLPFPDLGPTDLTPRHRDPTFTLCAVKAGVFFVHFFPYFVWSDES